MESILSVLRRRDIEKYKKRKYDYKEKCVNSTGVKTILAFTLRISCRFFSKNILSRFMPRGHLIMRRPEATVRSCTTSYRSHRTNLHAYYCVLINVRRKIIYDICARANLIYFLMYFHEHSLTNRR